MTRERDSQRSKVYAAEGEALGRLKTDYTSVAECQAYLDKVTSSAWFKRHYGTGYSITVQSGAGYRRATSYGGKRGRIQLPRWARKRWVIIHEVAHNVTKAKHGESIAAHGWQFAGIYLTLVTHYLGKEDGDRLKVAFKKHKVRFTPPRTRAPLSEEQKAIQVERLAAARAARAAKPRLVWEQTVKDEKGWKGLRDNLTGWWSLFEIQADGTEVEHIHRREHYWIGTIRKEAKMAVEGFAKKYPTSTFLVIIDGEVMLTTREYEPGCGYVTRYIKHTPHEEWVGHWFDPQVVAPLIQAEVGSPS